MTGIRRGWARGSASLRRLLGASDASLLPKILGTFILVLTLAAVVTLLLENRLTRQTLRDQARQLVGAQGDGVSQVAATRRNSLLRGITATAEELQLRRGRELDETDLVGFLASVQRTVGADVVTAFDDLGAFVATTPGPSIEPPPPGTIPGLTAAPVGRVVALSDGGFAQVVAVPVGAPDDATIVVAGFRLNDAAALELRALTGPANLVFVVDDDIVGSSLPDDVLDDAPPNAAQSRHTLQPLLGQDRFVAFVELARSDGLWGHDAAVGVVTADPLQALDRELLRDRVLMVVLLIGLGAVLAWGFARVMTRPLTRLTSTATSISSGNLEATFDVDRRDEIGVLAGALERMRRVLRAQLHVIRQQAGALQDAARRMISVQDEERRRLARDLHDGIQQQLVMLRLQVGLARARLQERPDSLGPVTDELADEIDHILERLRETGQGIFPSILVDRGLSGALNSLAARVELPLEVATDPDPLPRMPPDVESNAYFLIAEGVTNALKHARASRIAVEVRHEPDGLRVTVVDDGRGFDTATTLPASSVVATEDGTRAGSQGGMSHMRDRVNAVGGALQVASSPGDGTVVVAVFPVGEPDGGGVASAPGALEEEQHGGDAPVDLELLGEAELAEDRADVLLDRLVRDRQGPGDGGVSLP